jgi:hypothetical protein
MLDDVIVRNHEVVAAKPTEVVPPITLERIKAGQVVPAVKWSGSESGNFSGSGLKEKLQDRVCITQCSLLTCKQHF